MVPAQVHLIMTENPPHHLKASGMLEPNDSTVCYIGFPQTMGVLMRRFCNQAVDLYHLSSLKVRTQTMGPMHGRKPAGLTL